MTRSMEAAMLVLQAISGADSGDIGSVPSHLDFDANAAVKGLRIPPSDTKDPTPWRGLKLRWESAPRAAAGKTRGGQSSEYERQSCGFRHDRTADLAARVRCRMDIEVRLPV